LIIIIKSAVILAMSSRQALNYVFIPNWKPLDEKIVVY